MKRRDTDGTVERRPDHRIATVRLACGLSRSQLARKSGVSRRKLAEFERGAAVPTASELAAVAEACGVGRDEIARPTLDVAAVANGVGNGSSSEIRSEAASDALLREYLSMLLELRKASEIAPVSLRQDDLAELAAALGGTPEAIKARLVELLGTDSRGASEMLSFLTL